MQRYRVDMDSLEWVQVMPGLRQRAYREGGRQLRLVEYTKSMSPHWCAKGHVGLVLDGQFEIRFDDAVLVFKAGDGVFIPDGEQHRHMGRALSDVVRLVFVEDVYQ
jgi:ethanolamine utilization protein EutQ (cupin superfamily)